MSGINKKDPFLLFLGDIIIFFISLWATLLLRYQEMPSEVLWNDHILPFSILFIAWILVFFISGLYEKRTVILRKRLPSTILQSQLANTIIAVLFFYFIPYFGITPKTNLFICLGISFILILIWRIYGYTFLGFKRRQRAVIIASGEEMRELRDEVNAHKRFNLHFVSSIDLDNTTSVDFESAVTMAVRKGEVDVVVADFSDQKIEPYMHALYELMYSRLVFLDIHKVYEDVFDRIPVSLIGYNWFLENISSAPKRVYSTLKRIMDVAVSLPLALLSLIVYPFIIIAIKLNDGGKVFIAQERVGRGDKLVKIHKFRTMSSNDNGVYVGGKTQNVVTKVGAFLRMTRLDELPQLWDVVSGELSLIGPRPELPSLVKEYEREIPYYGIRHILKPGLSGWAQLYHDNHPHHGVAVEQTKEKLAYDLYYLKNRSIGLDLTIALKTIKKLLSRSGI